jgi:hypothetical protein
MATPTVATRAAPTVETSADRCGCAEPAAPTVETSRYQLSTTRYRLHDTTSHKMWDYLTLDAFRADTTTVQATRHDNPLRGNQR